jgi:hypothetical protein
MFKKFLAELSVSEIKAPENLVIIDSTESFVSAFSKLVTSNILSAPVYDAKMKKFIGYLEVRDLLSIVIAVTLARTRTFLSRCAVVRCLTMLLWLRLCAYEFSNANFLVFLPRFVFIGVRVRATPCACCRRVLGWRRRRTETAERYRRAASTRARSIRCDRRRNAAVPRSPNAVRQGGARRVAARRRRHAVDAQIHTNATCRCC